MSYSCVDTMGLVRLFIDTRYDLTKRENVARRKEILLFIHPKCIFNNI